MSEVAKKVIEIAELMLEVKEKLDILTKELFSLSYYNDLIDCMIKPQSMGRSNLAIYIFFYQSADNLKMMEITNEYMKMLRKEYPSKRFDFAIVHVERFVK
jgi:hypothetical protein